MPSGKMSKTEGRLGSDTRARVRIHARAQARRGNTSSCEDLSLSLSLSLSPKSTRRVSVPALGDGARAAPDLGGVVESAHVLRALPLHEDKAHEPVGHFNDTYLARGNRTSSLPKDASESPSRCSRAKGGSFRAAQSGRIAHPTMGTWRMSSSSTILSAPCAPEVCTDSRLRPSKEDSILLRSAPRARAPRATSPTRRASPYRADDSRSATPPCAPAAATPPTAAACTCLF